MAESSEGERSKVDYVDSDSTVDGLLDDSDGDSDSTIDGNLADSNLDDDIGDDSSSGSWDTIEFQNDLSTTDSTTESSESNDDGCSDSSKGGETSGEELDLDTRPSGPAGSNATEKCVETADCCNQTAKERLVVANIVTSECCDNKCLSHLTVHLVATTREKVNSLSQNARRQWIVDKIADNSSINDGNFVTQFNVGGSKVCRTAFQIVYSIPPKSLSRAITFVRNGERVVEHGNKGTKKPSEKVLNAMSWMSQYFKLVGDKMPNNEQTHLPSWDSRKGVFARYNADMQEEHGGVAHQHIIAASMFYKIWRNEFPFVRIPKVCYMLCLYTECYNYLFCQNNRFAKCDTCVSFKLEAKETLDKEKRKEINKARKAHKKLAE